MFPSEEVIARSPTDVTGCHPSAPPDFEVEIGQDSLLSEWLLSALLGSGILCSHQNWIPNI